MVGRYTPSAEAAGPVWHACAPHVPVHVPVHGHVHVQVHMHVHAHAHVHVTCHVYDVHVVLLAVRNGPTLVCREYAESASCIDGV